MLSPTALAMKIGMIVKSVKFLINNLTLCETIFNTCPQATNNISGLIRQGVT
jgi:hypothetical protein